MIEPGQIVLFRFPQTDLQEGKMRPILLLAKVPNRFDDWLVCAISTQLHQYTPDFDEIIRESDDDFSESGLKAESLFRIDRLGVLDASILEGAIRYIKLERLHHIRARLAAWISE